MDNFLFKCETSSGFIIKVLTEVIFNCITGELKLNIDKSGITCYCINEGKTTMINLNLKMENFEYYYYSKDKPNTIVLNLKQIQKALKDIKKKDSILLAIEENNDKLDIVVTPTGKGNDKRTKDSVPIFIVKYTNIEDIKIEFNYPKVISCLDFQKLCKKIQNIQGKEVNITIQNNYFISFYAKGSTEHISEFGQKVPNEIKEYENQFYLSDLHQLIKIPGLSSKMQIHSPKDNQTNTIKINVNTGSLGDITFYIKSKPQIDYEKTLQ